jgi:hypothetical protein
MPLMLTRATSRRPSPLPWVVLALVAAAGAWYAAGELFAGPPDVAPAPAPTPVAAAAPAAPVEEPLPPAPAPEKLDALLSRVSPGALWRNVVSDGDVLRRVATVVDNLGEGASPRAQLGFLAPGARFTVVTTSQEAVIAPESYARYDRVASAVAEADAAAIAEVYRATRGPLTIAYRALGYPGASLDRAVDRALLRILAAPVKDGPVAVVDEGGVWVFADERLEALSGVEKHLLRMGPANTRAIQAKARELRAELGFGAPRSASR